MTTFNINPYGTNQPQDAFSLETQGYVQGMPYDDVVARQWLMQGLIASNASAPLWGGVPIEELINVTGSGSDGIGPEVQAATSQATCTAWATFAQMMHGIITPGQSAPLYGADASLGFFRLGTQQRLAVACDPALVAALVASGGSISSQALYWDVTNYRITLTTSGGNWALPTSTRLLSVNTNSKIVTYASSAASWALGDAALILL